MNLGTVLRIKDPRRRAERAAELLRVRQTEVEKIRQARDAAANEMLKARKDGAWVYRPADVARVLGMTRASVAERFPHAKTRERKA